MAAKEMTAREQLAAIRKKMKHRLLDPNQQQIRMWMDTGEPLLDSVLGSKTQGIPYGRMIEISGNESQGKTLLALDLAAQAQYEGAAVGWMDYEASWDDKWAVVHGLDPEEVTLFEPYLGVFGKETEERLITAEELFEEAELWMAALHKDAPDGRIFLGIDSAAAILTDVEASAGISGQNMRTNNALPAFLSKLLRRWIAMAKNFNAMIVWVNQIRLKPAAFGNPEYTPGGKALRFYCSVRANMRRKGDQGKIRKAGKVIGIKGVLENLKNKSGGGSIEGEKVGFKLYFTGESKYITLSELEKL